MDAERQRLLKDFLRVAETHRNEQEKLKKISAEYRKIQKLDQEYEQKIQTLQTTGQKIGELMKVINDERFLVKVTKGMAYMVGARQGIPKESLVEGARVTLDMATYTIMRVLPREVDASVYTMLHEDTGKTTFESIGGLSEQLAKIREVIELPLTSPELFERVGIKPPSGVLLYGPPGTGKTLIARALANQIDANFIKFVASAIIDKYIGTSSAMIREIFAYARAHAPCIIFIDEIDAIGGQRLNDSNGPNREIQRTLMQLLAEMDGFTQRDRVKIIMATNRPDILDKALLRPGRLDRKIEIPLPNEQARYEILRIHSKKMALDQNVNFDPVVKMSAGFNGADLRNICTEAGIYAIRDGRNRVIQEDIIKATRDIASQKKLESKLEYKPV